MYGKLHEAHGGKVLAACDKALLGKAIEHGELCLEAGSEFYGDVEISEKQLAELLREADSANLLGEKAVGVAVAKGFVGERDVVHIGDVPHIQIFKL